MKILSWLEKTLDARLRGIFGGHDAQPGSGEAIEIYRAALDQIAARATVGKRGDRVFPFSRIRIELKAESPERQALLEALFTADQMGGDIRATLLEAGAKAPDDLDITVTYPEEAAVELRVICENAHRTAAEAPMAAETPFVPMRLVTLAGSSSAPELTVDRPHIGIGRVHEVLDAAGRPIRRNELFFPDEADEINATVSRAHAHIRFEPATGDWRIYDDGSSLGTAVFREGRRIEVPAHAARGVMLRPGDEIYLGHARLRCDAV